MKSLWPDDLVPAPEPGIIGILKIQGNWLTGNTKGVLKGRVQSEMSGTQMIHTLNVHAVLLRWTGKLLVATHDVASLYPVMITGYRLGKSDKLTPDVMCTSAEVENILKSIFAHEHTMLIIGNLLCMSQEITNDR